MTVWFILYVLLFYSWKIGRDALFDVLGHSFDRLSMFILQLNFWFWCLLCLYVVSAVRHSTGMRWEDSSGGFP